MTPEDKQMLLLHNPKISRFEDCGLAEIEGNWYLVVCEKQSDGELRIVQLGANDFAPAMLHQLEMGDPEKRKIWEARQKTIEMAVKMGESPSKSLN